jgi:hypothetical protein
MTGSHGDESYLIQTSGTIRKEGRSGAWPAVRRQKGVAEIALRFRQTSQVFVTQSRVNREPWSELECLLDEWSPLQIRKPRSDVAGVRKRFWVLR